MTSRAEIFSFPNPSRPIDAVASVLMDIAKSGETPFDELLAHLLEAGWYETVPVPIARLTNRLTANRFGNSHFSVKSRAGYSRVFRYVKKQRAKGLFPLSELLWPMTSKGIATHRNMGLVHPDLDNCFVSLVGPKPDTEKERQGLVYSLVFFSPHSPTNRSDSIVDIQSLAQYFDGTSKLFFTPVGNRRDIGYSWTFDVYPVEFEGRRETRKIMGLPHNLYFGKCRFLADLLPDLTLPQSCGIHTMMRSIW